MRRLGGCRDGGRTPPCASNWQSESSRPPVTPLAEGVRQTIELFRARAL
jgi:hypothetical protein